MDIQNNLRLIIPNEIWEDLQDICNYALPKEVSGVGTIEVTQKGLVFEKWELLPQVSSSSHTELNTAALVELMGKEKDPHKIKLWWHTHANFGVFWSGTDHSTANILAEAGEWFVSLVLNAKGESLARMDMQLEYGSFKTEIEVVHEIPVREDTGLREMVARALKGKWPKKENDKKLDKLKVDLTKVEEILEVVETKQEGIRERCGNCIWRVYKRREGKSYCAKVGVARYIVRTEDPRCAEWSAVANFPRRYPEQIKVGLKEKEWRRAKEEANA